MRGAEWLPVWIFLRSVPQTPQEATFTSISPGPMAGTGTVSTRMSLMPRYTTAFMSAGISFLIWVSIFEIWVAIPLPYFSFRIQKVEQRLRDTLGSPFTIFAHSNQCSPVPGVEKCENDELT